MSPRRSRRLIRAATGALAITALAAPAASARPVDPPAGWKLAPPAESRSQLHTAAPTVIRSTDDGFDWGAAGIGAGAGGHGDRLERDRDDRDRHDRGPAPALLDVELRDGAGRRL